ADDPDRLHVPRLSTLDRSELRHRRHQGMSGSLLSVSPLAGERTTGIRLRLAELVLEHARPVQVTLSSRPGRPINVGYDRVEHAPGRVRGLADVVLEEGPAIRVVDEWRAADRTVRCARRVAVATGA